MPLSWLLFSEAPAHRAGLPRARQTLAADVSRRRIAQRPRV
jgi:hypothetical protein